MSVLARLQLRCEQDVVHARQRARLIAELLGFERIDQTRISTVVSEIARNAFQYGGGGEVQFGLDATTAPQVFTIAVCDHGPGIGDPQAILQGHYSSRTGLGLGIVGARRLMDSFNLTSQPGAGTTVSLGKALPQGAARVTAATLTSIGEALQRTQAQTPLEEIRLQNSELLRAMQELQKREDISRQQATHDELTGLPNRRLFHDRLGAALAEARRFTRKLAVVFIDLDHFKDINDGLGHAAGDQLLQVVAQRIRAAVREVDTVARLGGDEFALALLQTESKELAGHAAQRILDAMAAPVSLEGGSAQASLSLGIAIFPDDGTDMATLLQRADQAMYRAKQAGGNCCHCWKASLTDQAP